MFANASWEIHSLVKLRIITDVRAQPMKRAHIKLFYGSIYLSIPDSIKVGKSFKFLFDPVIARFPSLLLLKTKIILDKNINIGVIAFWQSPTNIRQRWKVAEKVLGVHASYARLWELVMFCGGDVGLREPSFLQDWDLENSVGVGEQHSTYRYKYSVCEMFTPLN